MFDLEFAIFGFVFVVSAKVVKFDQLKLRLCALTSNKFSQTWNQNKSSKLSKWEITRKMELLKNAFISKEILRNAFVQIQWSFWQKIE